MCNVNANARKIVYAPRNLASLVERGFSFYPPIQLHTPKSKPNAFTHTPYRAFERSPRQHVRGKQSSHCLQDSNLLRQILKYTCQKPA